MGDDRYLDKLPDLEACSTAYRSMSNASALENIPLPTVELVERRFRAVIPREWNEFASRCGGSFMSAWPVIRLARVTNRVVIMEIVDITSPSRAKIGQCAVLVKKREIKFLDRILLLPGYEEWWSACMGALIAKFGARLYRYGSHWNEEPPRQLRAPPKHMAEEAWARDFHIDAVELGAWEDFNQYKRRVSSNIRRDLAKAENTPLTTFQIRRGWAALRDVADVVRVRSHVMEKNGKPFSRVADAIVHLGKILIFGKSVWIATASFDSKKQAALFCIEFGDCLYYVSGGVLPNDHGLGSLAMVKTIEHWYLRHPKGRFVMGYAPGQQSPERYTDGALLYRRKLRVSSRPGAEFDLRISRSSQRD